MSNPRVKVAAAVIAAALIVIAGVLLVAGGSNDDSEGPAGIARARLALERYESPAGRLELIVALSDPQLNSLETTLGETSVTLRCIDGAGAVRVRRQVEWPLLEETGYPLPHVHEPMKRKALDAVRTCKLTGTGIDFESGR